MLKKIIAIGFVVAGLTYAIYGFGTSLSVQSCVAQHYQNTRNQKDEEKTPSIGVLLVTRFGSVSPCVGEFINDNQGVITALSTIYIAVFTILLAVVTDLSPISHPVMSRVRSSFEPVWLGGATGRGAKPPSERSVPSRCFAETLSLA